MNLFGKYLEFLYNRQEPPGSTQGTSQVPGQGANQDPSHGVNQVSDQGPSQGASQGANQGANQGSGPEKEDLAENSDDTLESLELNETKSSDEAFESLELNETKSFDEASESIGCFGNFEGLERPVFKVVRKPFDPERRTAISQLKDRARLQKLRQNVSDRMSGRWRMVAILMVLFICSCQKSIPTTPSDPALRALGQASIRVLDQKLESPLGELEKAGGKGGVLTRKYVINGTFEGRASETLLAISSALGYGLTVENQRAGDLVVKISPELKGATILSLIKSLNQTLKPQGARIGVDSLNRRLVLSGLNQKDERTKK
ncbi:MAG: hypothetical protein LBE31_08290 [Deltaproteobacteria bacterium]|nr:hypothetical protein [Deltaproteobacteria bacterium]